jgi:hypothetical protein
MRRQKLLVGSKVGYRLSLMLNCKTLTVQWLPSTSACAKPRDVSAGVRAPGRVRLEVARLASLKLQKNEASRAFNHI